MKLTGFTAAGCNNGLWYFVGKKDKYPNAEAFINAAWFEFKLGLGYVKPSIDILSIEYLRETDDGYCFCAEHEPGAFEAYVLAEEDLIEGVEV